MGRGSERIYTELLFASSGKYAAWDPELYIRVGDWGTITPGTRRLHFAFWRRHRRNGGFLKHGNIYDDGHAASHGVPLPTTYEHAGCLGTTWVVSQNAVQTEVGADMNAQIPTIANCSIEGSFKFSSGQGAVLCMDSDALTSINPASALRQLLHDGVLPKGAVIVSEVHATAAYARFLAAPGLRDITIALKVDPPTSGGVTSHAGVNGRWLRSSMAGNFKSKFNPDGGKTYTPLFRLVALEEDGVANNLSPFPDAPTSGGKASAWKAIKRTLTALLSPRSDECCCTFHDCLHSNDVATEAALEGNSSPAH